MKIYNMLFWILLSILLSTTTLIAQPYNSEPTDFGTTGETENNPDDSPVVPLNINISLLFLVGIYYAFLKKRNENYTEKQKQNNKRTKI
jgi:hypothetical protein